MHKILEFTKKKGSIILWFFYLKFLKKIIKQIHKIKSLNKRGFKVPN